MSRPADMSLEQAIYFLENPIALADDIDPDDRAAALDTVERLVHDGRARNLLAVQAHDARVARSSACSTSAGARRILAFKATQTQLRDVPAPPSP